MSTTSSNSANPVMAFILGGVIVVLIGLGYYAFNGSWPGQPDAEISIDLDGQ